MNNRIVNNYKKVLESFGKSLEALPKSEEFVNNLTPAMVSLIKTIQLNQIGLQSKEIAELVNEGKLERVKQGYYRITEFSENTSEAKLISLLYPDGIITMTTALFYYRYSDRTPLTWDIAIKRNTSKSRFNIDYPYVQPYYVDVKHLDYGITKAEYDDCTLNIFDRDRLICECIKHENKLERETFNKAIINYINDNTKNITNLLDYAKRRNIHKKVRERIGVWL